MAKVTSKGQVTIPKAIAERYRIRPGDEITFVPAGDAIRVVPGASGTEKLPRPARLKLFDAATARQRARQRGRGRARARRDAARGWTRQDLYTRGRPR